MELAVNVGLFITTTEIALNDEAEYRVEESGYV
jgi:hypothetical protein